MRIDVAGIGMKRLCWGESAGKPKTFWNYIRGRNQKIQESLDQEFGKEVRNPRRKMEDL